MNEIILVVLIYATPYSETPETEVTVPLPGASMEVCEALGSTIKARTSHSGKPWQIVCRQIEIEPAI
jgi:hypothetical protein